MSKPISNNEFDSLDVFFSDKLKDASMPPSEKIWQQIEGSLNEDKKRKRRFLWMFFSGLFFIGITVATYFFVLANNKPVTAEAKNISVISKATVANTKTLNNNHADNKAITQIKHTKSAVITENIPKEEDNKIIKIQIGAFKKQKDKTDFSKINLDVKSEETPNGITRYYAEVAENQVPQALEQIKQAGFMDAFIKTKTLPTNNVDKAISSIAAKSTPNVGKEPVLYSTKNERKTNVAIVNKKQSSNNNAVENAHQEKSDQVNKTSAPASNEVSTVVNHITKKQVNNIDSAKNNVLSLIPTNTTSVSPPKETNDIAVKDSVQKDTTLNEIVSTKKDSTSAKPDSAKKIEPIAIADSSNKSPILNKWALLLTGGPNFFMKNAQSNLFAASGEQQPTTYIANLKIEFKPFKKFAFTAGVSYSYYIAQQDATLFYFNKNLTGDYIFYSSFGPMAVDKNTMLQGFNPAPFVTTLHANYSYTSRVNTLLVPVQLKYYYLNKKRINLFADIGVSGMMVLSQHTNLSVIKEYVTNNISYNQINTTKFNALLMLGLGGDVRLCKQLYFTVDGGLRYGMTNLSNTVGIKNNPVYFSANAGIKIKF